MTKARDLADNAQNTKPKVIDAKGDLIVGTGADAADRLAVSDNGSILVADSAATTGLRYQPAKIVNATFNSGFDIWQRGTSFAVSTGANYGPDRWRLYRAASGSTVSRSTDAPTNFIYSAKVQRDSGNNGTSDIYIGQALENVDSSRFIGQSVTLSYYAKAGANFSAASSQITAQVYTGTGTDQAVFDFSGAATSGGLQTITTSWVRYSLTATISASAKQVGFRFYFTPVGTAGADDSFYITGVQLELGSVPTVYSKLGGTIQGELAACQRYYYRFGGDTNVQAYGQGIGESTTAAGIFIQHPVPMRIAASSVDYSTLRLSDWASSNYAVTSLTISSTNNGRNGVVLSAGVASGLTANRPYFLFSANSASGYLGFSAEL